MGDTGTLMEDKVYNFEDSLEDGKKLEKMFSCKLARVFKVHELQGKNPYADIFIETTCDLVEVKKDNYAKPKDNHENGITGTERFMIELFKYGTFSGIMVTKAKFYVQFAANDYCYISDTKRLKQYISETYDEKEKKGDVNRDNRVLQTDKSYTTNSIVYIYQSELEDINLDLCIWHGFLDNLDDFTMQRIFHA